MLDAPPFCCSLLLNVMGGWWCKGAIMVPFHRLALGEDL